MTREEKTLKLDGAIKHAEEVANANERLWETVRPAMQLYDYSKCAKEHRQLAEWLKDYKRLLEQEPCEDTVSRAEVLKGYIEVERSDGVEIYSEKAVPVEYINNLPPVTTTRKVGNWIKIAETDEIVCEACNYSAVFKSTFCPHCGAEMRGAEE